MSYAPSVTIAVVNYNTRDALRDCLKSIERVRDEVSLDVVVVDNASADGSLAMMEYEFPELAVIANTENVGFARAVNQAFEQATGDYFFLLNPDTWLPRKTLTRLIEMAERDPEIATVGAQLTTFEGENLQSVLGKPGLLKEFLNLLPELKGVILPGFLKRRLLRRREKTSGRDYGGDGCQRRGDAAQV
jgi:N-acetylglucosaminyl-diphospho-decaprenol L-rhamnosyltransferase